MPMGGNGGIIIGGIPGICGGKPGGSPCGGGGRFGGGPMNPIIALLTDIIATSVERAAEAPFESESCFPALMALQGM